MRIRKPRNITGAQLGLVTVLGVLGGIYIWKPYFTKVKQPEEPVKEVPSES